MRSKHQLRVDKFMLKAGQEVPIKPKDNIDSSTRKLRAQLILEEALETLEALGCEVWVSNKNQDSHTSLSSNDVDINIDCNGELDIIKTIDGCLDSRVVTTGTLSTLGVDDEDVQEIVDQKNLEKFGPGSYTDDNGKLQKPKDFIGPEQEISTYIDKKLNE